MATKTAEKNPMGSNGNPTCDACSETIVSVSALLKISCGHVFHKSCLEKCVKTRPFCPICNSRVASDSTDTGTSQITTRAQAKQIGNPPPPAAANTVQGDSASNTSIGVVDQTERITQLVTNIVSAQQVQFMTTLTAQLSQLIEGNIASSLSRLMPSNSQIEPNRPSQSSPQPMQTLPAVEDRTFRELFGITPHNSRSRDSQNRPLQANGQSVLNSSSHGNSSSSDLHSRPDKVLQIMSNWKLKFNGGINGLSIDNFIYRVEALTAQTLQGNLDLLCGNASSLFEGKASDWFWRYHRSVSSIRWFDLCRSLREQYRDSRTDVDIRELIRERKQKPNESFDNFYESIVALTDRLKTPLSDEMLVEILRRNLLPEIQHEILNMEIGSLQGLRDTCRRREFFMQDMRRKLGLTLSKSVPLSKRISEIEDENREEAPDVCVPDDEIAALNLVCWNCAKSGHRYQDCLEERSIFCYGCGAPNTYKPNCSKCASKNGRSSAQKGAQNSEKTSISEL